MAKKKACKKSCSKKLCSQKSCESKPQDTIEPTQNVVDKNTKAGSFFQLIKKAFGYE